MAGREGVGDVVESHGDANAPAGFERPRFIMAVAVLCVSLRGTWPKAIAAMLSAIATPNAICAATTPSRVATSFSATMRFVSFRRCGCGFSASKNRCGWLPTPYDA